MTAETCGAAYARRYDHCHTCDRDAGHNELEGHHCPKCDRWYQIPASAKAARARLRTAIASRTPDADSDQLTLF